MIVKNYLLQLESVNGVENVNVECHFEETTDAVNISMELNGEKIELSHESTEAIFIDLVKLLKDRYEINSCFTCRFGNFCPIGDKDNEIFCINDFEPKCKKDIYFVTEDADEKEKRSRTLFGVCDRFKPCSEDYYTYK